jgi:hypothetical protein
MNLSQKLSYNKSSAAKHGWSPDWFGATTFDANLISKVEAFQKEYSLEVDGLVGPGTHRIASSLRFSEKEQYIVCGGKQVPIAWPKVIVMGEQGALSVPAKNYKKSPKRKPGMFVIHWDACLSSASCANVLKERGLSVHFCLDNDGTIYQLVDCDDIAYHAGGVNSVSVGVEVSNAFYPKYQSWYEKNGFGPRPVMTDTKVHGGKIDSHLDFYDVQKKALSVLIKTVCNWYGIPLQTPDSITEVPEVARGSYKGVVSHYHVTAGKIDCAGLEIEKLIE